MQKRYSYYGRLHNEKPLNGVDYNMLDELVRSLLARREEEFKEDCKQLVKDIKKEVTKEINILKCKVYILENKINNSAKPNTKTKVKK